ncbi:unnamed protein product [Thlaspi arvense]|uniref:Uncharacterized protein n=1 Tax=Thlaspi arvense TaxID=13288 RepID=A0AAU9S2S2_THLAR|nr:unnamed protein product [Thlaspi arvense]
MEASRICFGPKTLPNVHKPPLSLKTNLALSLFPRRLLQNNTFPSKKPSKHDLLCVKAESSGDLESTRPLTYFSPSFWGDHFLSVPVHDSEFEALEREIETVMRPKVRDMLVSPHSSDKDRIRLIHLLISLAIAHYFESEIEEILHQAFRKLDGIISEEDDLETIAIMFEVFRLYGHKMSCDVFDRFKGEDGKLKQSLAKDARGMLQLYEAAHLGTPSEDIMDEAISFTRYHLESLTSQETSDNLFKHIQNALYRARYHSIEILVARQYISFYDQEEGHDETILKFAKLNFNFCQMHYVKELKIVTKWWKELDVAHKLPYIRDRNVEVYLGGLGIYFEPRYSPGRIIVAKLTMILTVVDDTFDAYATLPESLNIDREMRARGKLGRLQLTIDETKSLTKLYLTIAKWARASHVQSFEDYIENGIPAAAMTDFAAYSFIAMDDCEQEQLNEWFYSKPKILQAINAVFRLSNDIVTYEQEVARGEVANGVHCYMKQHGVSKEAAIEELTKMERENYKIMMEEFMTSKAVPRQILVRLVNIARVIDLYYKNGDGFGQPDQQFKDLLASLFLQPIPL